MVLDDQIEGIEEEEAEAPLIQFGMTGEEDNTPQSRTTSLDRPSVSSEDHGVALYEGTRHQRIYKPESPQLRQPGGSQDCCSSRALPRVVVN